MGCLYLNFHYTLHVLSDRMESVQCKRGALLCDDAAAVRAHSNIYIASVCVRVPFAWHTCQGLDLVSLRSRTVRKPRLVLDPRTRIVCGSAFADNPRTRSFVIPHLCGSSLPCSDSTENRSSYTACIRIEENTRPLYKPNYGRVRSMCVKRL